MMRRLDASAMCLTLMLAGSMLAPEPARSAAYPVNVCVGRKQKDAGKYCKAVFHAWSAWEKSQDTGRRDSSLQRAATRFAARWARAEANALRQGTDCAETTLGSAAAQSLMDGAVGGVVTAINAGLDLGNAADARCGRALLSAAALDCGSVLTAEGIHVKDLQGDADATVRDAALAAASAGFGRAWTSKSAPAAPPPPRWRTSRAKSTPPRKTSSTTPSCRRTSTTPSSRPTHRPARRAISAATSRRPA